MGNQIEKKVGSIKKKLQPDQHGHSQSHIKDNTIGIEF